MADACSIRERLLIPKDTVRYFENKRRDLFNRHLKRTGPIFVLRYMVDYYARRESQIFPALHKIDKQLRAVKRMNYKEA